MTKEQYENKLRAKGYELIGRGLYANVFSIPGTDKAIKVADLDTWPQYIYWATQAGYAGKFAPKVYSLKFKADDKRGDFYVALMERLVCTMGQIRTKCCYTDHNALYGEVTGWNSSLDDCEAKDLVAYIRDMKKNGFSGDMHDGNAMLRHDGQLVITDPSSSQSTRRVRIKSGVCL